MNNSAGPVRITAYGAHLLALECRHKASVAAVECDAEAKEFHEQCARTWSDLSIGLRTETIKYVPGFPEHRMAYQRAISVLKP